MDEEARFLRAIRAQPFAPEVRQVYADWLEERGDPRGEFLRLQLRLRRHPPDHPARFPLETELSRTRIGAAPEWLNIVEPERQHLYQSPLEPPTCDCLEAGYQNNKWPRLAFHLEPQDTHCDAWKRLVDRVEDAAARQLEVFRPLEGLSLEERAQIVTLPPNIAKLDVCRELQLYGSDLVRIPAEIGQMSNLANFVPYTSYRLHWFPYELRHCPRLTASTVSTRAIYGNFKYRPPFPELEQPAPSPDAPADLARSSTSAYPAVERACAVCRRLFLDEARYRVWISLGTGSDVLPLLANCCSQACVDGLPQPSENHVAGPHRGGPQVVQPPRRF